MLCLLYGPALTTVQDRWEDDSLDYTDLCQRVHNLVKLQAMLCGATQDGWGHSGEF